MSYKHQLTAVILSCSIEEPEKEGNQTGIINQSETLCHLNNLFLLAAFDFNNNASPARDRVSIFSSDYSRALIAEQC